MSATTTRQKTSWLITYGQLPSACGISSKNVGVPRDAPCVARIGGGRSCRLGRGRRGRSASATAGTTSGASCRGRGEQGREDQSCEVRGEHMENGELKFWGLLWGEEVSDLIYPVREIITCSSDDWFRPMRSRSRPRGDETGTRFLACTTKGPEKHDWVGCGTCFPRDPLCSARACAYLSRTRLATLTSHTYTHTHTWIDTSLASLVVIECVVLRPAGWILKS